MRSIIALFKKAFFCVAELFRQKVLYSGVKFGRRVSTMTGIIWGCRNHITIGDDSRIERFCRIAGGDPGRILIGAHCHIAESTVMRSFAGNIEISDYVLLNYGCILLGNGGIQIGENSKLAPYCVVAASNHRFDDPEIAIRLQGVTSQGIKIGKDVWVGAHCVILDGAEIGDGAIIGAGAVVLGKIPALGIAVGVPAKVIKFRGDCH